MGTNKRERQKQGRQARLEAARAAQARSRRLRTLRNFAIFAVLVVAALFLLSRTGDDGDESVSSDATSTTAVERSDANPGEFAFGTAPCPAADGSSPKTLEFPDTFEQCIDPAKTYTAVFDTTEGEIVVELSSETPGTTNNFVALARYHYYDDTLIFRTDPSIGIIQGGSPHTQNNADPGPGFNLPDEGFDLEATGGTGPYSYGPGDLVMARSAGPDSASAQFFFGVNDAVAALDQQGTYVKFGTTVEGLDVLDKILASHQADPSSQLGGAPNPPVTITTVTIEES